MLDEHHRPIWTRGSGNVNMLKSMFDQVEAKQRHYKEKWEETEKLFPPPVVYPTDPNIYKSFQSGQGNDLQSGEGATKALKGEAAQAKQLFQKINAGKTSIAVDKMGPLFGIQPGTGPDGRQVKSRRPRTGYTPPLSRSNSSISRSSARLSRRPSASSLLSGSQSHQIAHSTSNLEGQSCLHAEMQSVAEESLDEGQDPNFDKLSVPHATTTPPTPEMSRQTPEQRRPYSRLKRGQESPRVAKLVRRDSTGSSPGDSPGSVSGSHTPLEVGEGLAKGTWGDAGRKLSPSWDRNVIPLKGIRRRPSELILSRSQITTPTRVGIQKLMQEITIATRIGPPVDKCPSPALMRKESSNSLFSLSSPEPSPRSDGSSTRSNSMSSLHSMGGLKSPSKAPFAKALSGFQKRRTGTRKSRRRRRVVEKVEPKEEKPLIEVESLREPFSKSLLQHSDGTWHGVARDIVQSSRRQRKQAISECAHAEVEVDPNLQFGTGWRIIRQLRDQSHDAARQSAELAARTRLGSLPRVEKERWVQVLLYGKDCWVTYQTASKTRADSDTELDPFQVSGRESDSEGAFVEDALNKLTLSRESSTAAFDLKPKPRRSDSGNNIEIPQAIPCGPFDEYATLQAQATERSDVTDFAASDSEDSETVENIVCNDPDDPCFYLIAVSAKDAIPDNDEGWDLWTFDVVITDLYVSTGCQKEKRPHARKVGLKADKRTGNLIFYPSKASMAEATAFDTCKEFVWLSDLEKNARQLLNRSIEIAVHCRRSGGFCIKRRFFLTFEPPTEMLEEIWQKNHNKHVQDEVVEKIDTYFKEDYIVPIEEENTQEILDENGENEDSRSEMSHLTIGSELDEVLRVEREKFLWKSLRLSGAKQLGQFAAIYDKKARKRPVSALNFFPDPILSTNRYKESSGPLRDQHPANQQLPRGNSSSSSGGRKLLSARPASAGPRGSGDSGAIVTVTQLKTPTSSSSSGKAISRGFAAERSRINGISDAELSGANVMRDEARDIEKHAEVKLKETRSNIREMLQ